MATLEENLGHMINHGSSVVVSWGEDNGCWEVDWITSGERFRGVGRSLETALVDAIRAARDRFGTIQISGIG